jgi:hypothetical protein
MTNGRRQSRQANIHRIATAPRARRASGGWTTGRRRATPGQVDPRPRGVRRPEGLELPSPGPHPFTSGAQTAYPTRRPLATRMSAQGFPYIRFEVSVNRGPLACPQAGGQAGEGRRRGEFGLMRSRGRRAGARGERRAAAGCRHGAAGPGDRPGTGFVASSAERSTGSPVSAAYRVRQSGGGGGAGAGGPPRSARPRASWAARWRWLRHPKWRRRMNRSGKTGSAG